MLGLIPSAGRLNSISQIFKNMVPTNMLLSFLDKFCFKYNDYYTFNVETFKKGCFNNEVQPFVELCKPYYYKSKLHYLNKKLTYNSFTTILRQICKHNNIAYTSKIKYEKSSYNIVYYVCASLPTIQ